LNKPTTTTKPPVPIVAVAVEAFVMIFENQLYSLCWDKTAFVTAVLWSY